MRLQPFKNTPDVVAKTFWGEEAIVVDRDAIDHVHDNGF